MLISVTNKKTQLHKSHADLSVVCAHEHQRKGVVSSDISFFRSSSAPLTFAQIYKTDAVEIWRAKTSNDGVEYFDKLRKFKSDEIQAIAGGKVRNEKPEFAIGSTDGEIKVCDLQSNKTKFAFPAEPSKSSVLSLDYSSDGSYLSSVYENGLINIYGLTTKIKFCSVELDKNSTLSRFHPAKRFQIALASFKGAVTVYDISSKKVVYQDRHAHDAPCRDLSMPEDIPDRLLTCGCDSFIKIYDMRQRLKGLQIESHCGLSTISASKCGGFFAVGNLKGELLTYDIRDFRKPLAKMKVDSELITRVEFLPVWDDVDTGFLSLDTGSLSLQRDSGESSASDDLPDPPPIQDVFTMNGIIEVQKGRLSEFDLNCSARVSSISTRRGNQSWSNDCASNSGGNDDRRMSDMFGQNLANAFRDLSFSSDLNDGVIESNSPILNYSNVEIRKSNGKNDSIPKRRSSFMPKQLQKIQEELCDKENQAGTLNSPNPFTEQPRFSSTPANVRFNLKQPENDVDESEEVIDVDDLDSFTLKSKSENSGEKPATTGQTIVNLPPPPTVVAAPQIDFKKEFENLHEKIHFEVQSLNFDLNFRHLEMMTHISNQRRNLENRIKTIEECMAFLLDDDAKIARVTELQQENRELRQHLAEVMNRINM